MSLAQTANDNVAPRPAGEAKPDTQPMPSPPPAAGVPMPAWKMPLYMAASVLLFLTQGLGMNLLTANIYQLQGSFSATTTELSWLSAAYMAPYASMSIALFKIRSQYGRAVSLNSALSASSLRRCSIFLSPTCIPQSSCAR